MTIVVDSSNLFVIYAIGAFSSFLWLRFIGLTFETKESFDFARRARSFVLAIMWPITMACVVVGTLLLLVVSIIFDVELIVKTICGDRC